MGCGPFRGYSGPPRLPNGTIWMFQRLHLRRNIMRDLIIVGGGAAGLSAAMYALGKQLDFLIIYETFGKAGTAQHLIGQVEEEYLAGSEAVRLFERRMEIDSGHAL